MKTIIFNDEEISCISQMIEQEIDSDTDVISDKQFKLNEQELKGWKEEILFLKNLKDKFEIEVEVALYQTR